MQRQVGFAICVFLILILFVGCGSAVDRTLEQSIERTYGIDPTASISISNVDGSIQVYGSNAPEMKLHAIKKAYTSEGLEKILVNVSVHADSASIETIFPPKRTWGLFDRSGTVDYILIVPSTSKISHLELVDGEVLIDGMHGEDVNARLANGRLSGHNCFGNLNLAVMSGNFAVAYEWWEQRKFSVEAAIQDGNGSAFIPGDASFHLGAETTNGKIANDFAEKQNRRDEAVTKIDMVVGGGNDVRINLRATNGNIKIVEANP